MVKTREEVIEDDAPEAPEGEDGEVAEGDADAVEGDASDDS